MPYVGLANDHQPPHATGKRPAARQAGDASPMLVGIVAVYAFSLIIASVALFMMNNASARMVDLVDAQNKAALALSNDLEYFKYFRIGHQADDQSLPPRLFDNLVTFSRTNAAILKTVHRLNPARMFSQTPRIETVLSHIRPADGTTPPPVFDHVGVDPATDATDVLAQGYYQIELFQAIRDFAEDEGSFYKDCLAAVSGYVMPVLYALLGAFLWTFRGHSGAPASERTRRFMLAAIAGIAISGLGSLIPGDLPIPPVAIAFVLGYSVDLFTKHIDGLVAKALGNEAPPN